MKQDILLGGRDLLKKVHFTTYKFKENIRFMATEMSECHTTSEMQQVLVLYALN